MKLTDIYQTLEDRNNYGDVEKNGPFFCSEKFPDGTLKKGIKEPWLGEGYYFWDTRIENARWWGKTVYSKSGYVICHTRYNQHSPLLYDLVGDVGLFDEFVNCAELLVKRLKKEYLTVPALLSFIRKTTDFQYKAIRVWPYNHNIQNTAVVFPDNKMVIGKMDKIQICFFDKTLLTEPYNIVFKNSSYENQTI